MFQEKYTAHKLTKVNAQPLNFLWVNKHIIKNVLFILSTYIFAITVKFPNLVETQTEAWAFDLKQTPRFDQREKHFHVRNQLDQW